MQANRMAWMACFSVCCMFGAHAAGSDAFKEYSLETSFSLPGTSSEWGLAVLNDGRLMVARNAGGGDVAIYHESAIASRTFEFIGTLPFQVANLSFLSVSPDGATFAIGNFSEIAVCDVCSLACTAYTANHFDGTWIDGSHLAITGSDPSFDVAVVDLESDSREPNAVVIIENVSGFSAGLTVDSAGNLYVGTATIPGGPIRYFDNPSWTNALATETPLDYETNGTLIVDLLSAITLGFDNEGNLHVGGSGAKDAFAGLVHASAVAAAIANQGPADPEDPNEVREFVATDCDIAFYLPVYNPVTEELHVRCYGSNTVDVYSVAAVCAGVADCADLDGNGVRDDNCAWSACAGAACAPEEVIFADVGGAFTACQPDGFCNLFDRTHVLTCFAGTSPCPAMNIDIGGPFGGCCPDGFCNLFDAGHVDNCFSGMSGCACPDACDECPGGTFAAAAVDSMVSGRARLVMTSARNVIQPGDTVGVDVFIEGPVELQAYQLHLGVSGGKAGRLDLVDIALASRSDAALGGTGSRYGAVNAAKAQMLQASEGGALRVPGRGYLATFTYQASADAEGVFVVDILHDELAGDQTFLVGRSWGKVEISGTTPAAVESRR